MSRTPDSGYWRSAPGAWPCWLLLLLSRYGSPARRAALFGAATAVVWSVDAAFVKQTVDVLAHGGLPALLTHWPLYAMIATGVLGTVLLQGAYAVGPLAASQATLLIVDPLASIALGIELFHEQLNTGPGYLARGGRVARRARGRCGHAVGLGSSGDDGRGTRPAYRPRALRRGRGPSPGRGAAGALAVTRLPGPVAVG